MSAGRAHIVGSTSIQEIVFEAVMVRDSSVFVFVFAHLSPLITPHGKIDVLVAAQVVDQLMCKQ